MRDALARALRNRSGLALLSAMLSVALLTLIVVEMTDTTLVHTHLARNSGDAVSASLLARSAEDVAEKLLRQNAKESPRETHRCQPWALAALVQIPILDIGMAQVQITDEGGKLDLNKVDDEAQRAALDKVFQELALDSGLLDGVEAWTARDPDASGARSYCALPACEPRGGPLATIDDLRLIRGFDDATIAKLRPYVTAFGQKGSAGVNVNTADPLVLRALGCEVGADFGPKDGCSFSETPPECAQAKPQVTRKSSIFTIEAMGEAGDTRRVVSAIVKVSTGAPARLSWKEHPGFDIVAGEIG